MAQRGTGSDAGPNACPFIALELDRDRRSERPDYRHRCYAEPVPAPRTVAHQERFCLSPNFPGCPIFQDWAVRAAARPVPLPQGHESRRAATDVRAGASMTAAGAAAMSTAPSGGAEDVPEPPADSAWPDSMDTSPPAAAIGGASVESAGARQLGAFDSAPPNEPDSVEPPAGSEPPPVDQAYEPPRYEPPAASEPPPADLGTGPDIDETGDAAPVPAFLAGRSARPRPSPKVEDRVTREDVVPSWEITDRYGAQQGGEPRGGGLFGRLLTILAVVIILALGVAAVVLIPGLLNASPGSTPRPSFAAVATPSPAVSTTAVAPTPTEAPVTAPPESVEPTPEATPEPSPRLYRIKSGDTLVKISRRVRVSVPDILAANPQITNPNHIQVGQVIVIPPRATPAP